MDLKEDIKSRLNIEEVIGRYVQLKRAGRNFKGLSPFTNEKTPSFVVSPEKQIWHDFSSNKGGDMFSFVMEVEGLDFKEALELLSRQAGINMGDYKQFQSDGSSNSNIKEKLYLANKYAQILFQNNLKRYPESIAYIKHRGISKQSVIDYGIGWAGGANDNQLYNFLKTKGLSDDEIIKSGLGINKYGKIRDVFRNRLVVSLTDIEGRVVGFTGRTLIEGNSKIPKYLNTSQTLIYDKGRQVFGLSLAKKFIKENDEAILVEGNLDVITLFQAGFNNVVATAGTAMTINHLKQIKRFSQNVVLAYDSDVAGINATERAIIIAEEAEMTIYIVTIDSRFKDPDEIVRADPNLFRLAIQQKKYGLDWLLIRYQRGLDLNSAPGKMAFIDRLAGILVRLNDPLTKDHYIKKAAEITNFSVKSIQLKLARFTESGAKLRLKAPRVELKQHDKNQQQELDSIIDELITLAYKFKLKTKVLTLNEEDASASLNQIRLRLASSNSLVDDIDKLLSSNDNYAKIILLRSSEQFVNWSNSQVKDHQEYLQEKSKILILKNKIEKVSLNIKSGSYKDNNELTQLLGIQRDLMDQLRGNHNAEE
jgi:DNA primase